MQTLETIAEAMPAAPAQQEPIPGTVYSDEHVLEAQRLVTLDWCETTLWAHDCARLGIDSTDQALMFETEDGRTFNAWTTRRAGHQGWRVLVLAAFSPARIVLGRFRHMLAGERQLGGGWTPHPSVAELPDPQVAAGGEPAEALGWSPIVATSRELVERCAWILPATGRVVAVVWRRRRLLHPVVQYWARSARHAAVDPESAGVLVRITIPGTVRLELIGEDAEDVTLDDDGDQMPADQACAPTARVRAAYEHGEHGSLTQELVAHMDEPEPAGCVTRFDRRWLALGVMPKGNAARAAALVAECLDDYFESVWDERPGAQARSANQAGTQRFGASFGSLVRFTSPIRAREALRVIASDEELRPVHWYSAAGTPVSHGTNPQLRTHNRRLDWRNTRDKLGLTVEPPKVAVLSKRTTDDEQHSDDLGIAAFLGLWSDPALEETIAHVVGLDSLDTQLLNEQRNSAARGVGRPMLSSSNAAWLFAGTDIGTTARLTVEGQIRALMATWEGKAVMERDPSRPVKPVATLTGNASWNLTDPRTGEPMRAAAPYEHAAVITGLLAAAQVVDEQHARMALALAREITTTVLSWVYHDEAGNPRWPFVIGCEAGERDGLRLPAEWLRVGAPELDKVARLGGSWTGWTIGAALAEQYLADIGLPLSASLRSTAAQLRVWLEFDAPDAPGADVVDRMAAVPRWRAQAQPLALVGATA